jgi:ABC-2 type transport system ATP-binding protein
VDKLAKSFGSHQVLREVSLNIPEGQTFALLGRNGAGKTTMIQIMLGLIAADSGKVRLAGLDPAYAPVKLRTQVGYLAEDQVMYGWMTPIELCCFLAPFYPTLAAGGIDHEVVDLSLDEIFEAFVIGRTVDWPDK